MKEYRSSSFQTRIEANLANISSSPEDEFKLHSAYYDTNTFDCELCGHRNCVYAFEVKNLKTDRILKIGSECINHFEGRGVDIDLAEGLMKRVMQTTQKARKSLIGEMGEEEYKKLSKEEKREKITRQYMVEQVKQMLKEMVYHKSVLTEEDVKHILDLGLEKEYEKAKEKMAESETLHKAHNIITEFQNYLSSLKETWSQPEEEIVLEYKKQYEEFHPNSQILDIYLKDYKRQLDNRTKYDWLVNYKGRSDVVFDIQKSFLKHGSLSPKQERFAKSLIDKEGRSNDDLLSRCFTFLFSHHMEDDFIKSLKRQYDSNGFLSEKQEKSLLKIYNKKRHWAV